MLPLLLLGSSLCQNTTTTAQPRSTQIPIVFQCSSNATVKQPNGCPSFLTQPFNIRFFYDTTGRAASEVGGIFTLRRGRELIFERNGTFIGNETLKTVEWFVDPSTFLPTLPNNTDVATARIQLMETIRGVRNATQYTVSSFLFENVTATTTSSLSSGPTVVIGARPTPTQSNSEMGINMMEPTLFGLGLLFLL